MIHDAGTQVKRGRGVTVGVLATACLVLAGAWAGTASAFTKTIKDIEDPAVEVAVLSLDVEANRGLTSESYCLMEFCPSPFWLSSEHWSHSLEGSTGGALSPTQFPKVLIERDPTVVRIEGDLLTDKAEGLETYRDFEHCMSGRTTTESPRLGVTLEGFYPVDDSATAGNPAFSLETQEVDHWTGGCSSAAIDTSSRTTRIDLLSSAGVSGSSGSWAPQDHDLVVSQDECSADHCDFTINGSSSNRSVSYSGHAEGTFTLGIRLNYPEENQQLAAPNTKITKAPRKLIRTKRTRVNVRFRFRSTGPERAKFKCRLNRGPFIKCPSNFKRKVRPGKHRLAVAATYRGKTDKTPAIYKWRVKKSKP